MSMRNIAIIAHVDHGKTTLVDQLLAQSGVFRANEATTERAMDSNDQERERGITILAKCTSVLWNGEAGETRINIIDTPGHADFGGEVERILGMVDGCVLLVDAEEGVMPQTKFVLTKALKMGLRPILCINKVDRAHADPDKVHNAAFDLFAAIGATDEQLDFPHIYASGRAGWATLDMNVPNDNLAPLFDLIVRHVPEPKQIAKKDEPFQILNVLIESDPFLGRLLTGRIESGKAVPGMAIHALDRDGKEIERGRITKVLAFRGLKRSPVDEGAEAGDIVAIAGMSKATVADTLCALEVTEALPAQPIDPPTISMTVSVNDSPLAGREGDKVQSRVIRDRLLKEAESNVAIKVTETSEGDAYEVSGRGELQLGVLIENMRREGFEVSISRPRVVFQTDPETGKRLEPMEDVMIDVDDEYSGIVIEKLSLRKAELKDMGPSGAGKTRIQLVAPSRSLIGYQGEFLTDTRGSGVLNRVFSHYEPYKGPIDQQRKGVLISNSDGETAAYALWNLEERGTMFVGAGEKTYLGMIIGENARQDDLDVNPMKAKQLTNVRASGKDESIRLTPPRRMTLEQAIAYIEEDELVEVTPKNIRLRKQILNPSFRKRRVKEE
ncbi:GTP-binding protein TypA [Caulobacter sp. Root656]|uniref:Large ribosomal subunit assembly factor BipA n=1 Tax=Caulobacter rhizosphaerae TaxID=2010972 RepID=A0ABU1N0F7_9CAUL|nr:MULTISPECIES: translational GTPase TypA [Caulobacter]KQZ31749.1 GTP-binding protein TypA [Caulobacter sp. Root1472]KRA62515.1 GTP-binding protein TypA [Caulobacter sp. Root656]MDR6531914.1 GTP-binding protein [Caulobacter rhizosphaerae]GGL42776.1 GTP-binding protein [Caulobacter rhizosphaerae]